jgi:hypothetical protein
MIVKKSWTTRIRKPNFQFYFEGKYFSIVERDWEGYFLFGVIPLWIEQVRNTYHN